MGETWARSRLWLTARVALCAAALAYVLARAELHDAVWLKGVDAPVRFVGLRGNQVEIVNGGQSRIVSLEHLQRNADGSLRIRFGLASLWRRSNKRLFLIGLALYGLQPVLQVVRFKLMLRLQRVRVRWRDAAAVCWVGNFYNFVIPGTTGGDVVRAAYLVRSRADPHGAVVAIGLDRLTGLAGLLSLASFVGLLLSAPQPTVWRVGLLSLAILTVMIIGFVLVTGCELVGNWLGRLPFGDHLKQLYAAVSVARDRWITLTAAIGMTILLQSAAMGAFSVAAVALGMQPVWQQYFVCVPIALVVAAVPIVPMGLGTLEATMVLLLAGQVGAVSQVLALAVSMRFMGLFWALPGGLLPLIWSGAPSRG